MIGSRLTERGSRFFRFLVVHSLCALNRAGRRVPSRHFVALAHSGLYPTVDLSFDVRITSGANWDAFWKFACLFESPKVRLRVGDALCG
jgi:hypothetical protein